MTTTEWKEPALAWNGSAPDPGQARILEIRSDAFIPEFLEGMAAADPLAYFDAHQLAAAAAGTPLKLYQPLHGCYYLVTASLVCRQLGLPDKAIDRANGENVFFVIRRRSDEGEQAWIQEGNSGHWQTLQESERHSVAPDEERLPLHPVQIYPRPETPHSVFTDNIEREIHYGYIPTGYRDKYKDTVGRLTPPTTSPETLVNDFIAEAEADAEGAFSFRAEAYRRRVHEPWFRLVSTPSINAGLPTSVEEQWLYALLELGDYFKSYLPSLWAAIVENDVDLLSGKTHMTQIFQRLDDDALMAVTRNGVSMEVSAAIRGLEPYFDLVRGQGNPPSATYNNLNVGTSDLDELLLQIADAVAEEEEPIQLPAEAESEMVRLITEQVQPRPEGGEPQYHIRTVYEYDPDCPPVVSTLASQPFTLARLFEPDAPARMIRLEAPSIKPQDLRRYARGVGIEMSPELHNLASCMAGGDVNGVIGSLQSCASSGLSIQMICTFSIQIIFLVAFIVMFIFLIALNFIFWWLAYLRICLPIPRRS